LGLNSGKSLKAIYILSVSNAVFTMGYGMYAYVFPKFLISVGAAPPQVGLVSTILTLFMAITIFPGGLLSDGGHRRKLVIASWLLPAFAPPFFILAQLSRSWLSVIPGVIVFASGWIGVPAVSSYTCEASPSGKRGLSFGLISSSSSLGLIASPLIGGLIVEAYGFTVLFLTAFALYAVSTFMVLTIPKFPGDRRSGSDITTSGSDTAIINDFKRAVRTKHRKDMIGEKSQSDSGLGALRRLIPMLMLSCLFMGLVYIGWSYIPIYLSYQDQFDYVHVQLLYAISNLSSFVVVNVLGKISDKYSPRNKLLLISIPAFSLVIGYWILVSSSDLLPLSIGFILLGSVGSVFPLIYSVVGELSVEKRVGRTYGVVGTFIYAAESTTPYLGGVLYATTAQLPFILTLELIPIIFIGIYIAHVRTH
jgi:MFS family permease